jgi:hypothetical protein
MKISKKQILFLILAIVFVCSALVACGDKSTESGNNNKSDSEGQQGEKASDADVETTTAEAYEYQDFDGGGANFTVLAPTNTWFYYTKIVHEQQTGDILDDAIYKRNRFIEDKFKINIVEKNMPTDDMWNFNPEVRKVCKSNMDTYDAIFVPASFNGTVGAMITEGLFWDLAAIPTIDLTGEWWNQTMLKEAAIGTGSQIFYTGSGINMFTLQAVSCVYFNQDMFTSLQLELPYNKVREGKWTYDVFQEYIKNGTNLNGAADFKWENSGTAIYGFVGYEDSATALLAGSGAQFINTDADGKPVLAIGDERFISALMKIAEILNPQNGNYLYANANDGVFHYEPIFRNGRGLMTIGELKAANVFRDMEATFGILPIPKYDEKQDKYYSHLINQAPVLVIPITNPRTDITGAVLDAWAYVSNRDVTRVLFDVSVAQKQLRNEESIEMLETYMKNTGSFEIGIAYGWTNVLYDAIRTKIGNGKPMEVASEIDKSKDKINSAIQKTLDLFD